MYIVKGDEEKKFSGEYSISKKMCWNGAEHESLLEPLL